MPRLQVDTLSFDFGAGVNAQLYDRSQHYTTVWNASPGGKKAVDVVAVQSMPPPSTTWLIEAKDFRVITNPPRPCNIGRLAQLVTDKVNDTLAGLADATSHASEPGEKAIAASALASGVKRVVLHLEPHTGPHTALFPTAFAANVLQQLRQLVRSIDANPLVLNIASTSRAGVPWNVS
ncbi:hypothetical protein [Prosthecobacter sp.]|uniref:hypothetical protein n=1 Tax=Prosthecobacter sp. TaxID=1965333 RepID=UPI003784362B